MLFRSLYVTMLFKMQSTDHYMHWLPQNCCYLFIYRMPMHRKRVRLKSQRFNVLWCAHHFHHLLGVAWASPSLGFYPLLHILPLPSLCFHRPILEKHQCSLGEPQYSQQHNYFERSCLCNIQE